MTSSCNWDNRVKRAEPAIVGFGGKLGPIQSDGKLICMFNESQKTGFYWPVYMASICVYNTSIDTY